MTSCATIAASRVASRYTCCIKMFASQQRLAVKNTSNLFLGGATCYAQDTVQVASMHAGASINVYAALALHLRTGLSWENYHILTRFLRSELPSRPPLPSVRDVRKLYDSLRPNLICVMDASGKKIVAVVLAPQDARKEYVRKLQHALGNDPKYVERGIADGWLRAICAGSCDGFSTASFEKFSTSFCQVRKMTALSTD